ncbi:MAG: hypothetical protein WC528_01875 [Patescibacteria group bacterium]
MVIKSAKVLAAMASFGLILIVVASVISGLRMEKRFILPFAAFLVIALVPYLLTLLRRWHPVETLRLIFILTLGTLILTPDVILDPFARKHLLEYSTLVFGCLFISGLLGWATRALYDNFRIYLEEKEEARIEELRKQFPWINDDPEDK